MEPYSAIIKSEATSSAATWMDLEIITLSEVRSARERQISYDITYVRNLKEKMIQRTHPKNRYRLTDFKNKLTLTKGEM